MLKQQSKNILSIMLLWKLNNQYQYTLSGYTIRNRIYDQKRLLKISYNFNISIMTAFMIIVKLGTLNERGVKHLNIFSMNFEYVVYVKSLICT